MIPHPFDKHLFGNLKFIAAQRWLLVHACTLSTEKWSSLSGQVHWANDCIETETCLCPLYIFWHNITGMEISYWYVSCITCFMKLMYMSWNILVLRPTDVLVYFKLYYIRSVNGIWTVTWKVDILCYNFNTIHDLSCLSTAYLMHIIMCQHNAYDLTLLSAYFYNIIINGHIAV